jgi:predicted nucleic acid-binding protein
VKPVCCDTSFLVAFYGNDSHTARARTHVHGMHQPLTISVLNSFELENALRFAAWRQLLGTGEVRACLAAFEADCRAGTIIVAACDLAQIITEGRRLSAAHTVVSGHRSFNILHLAAALQLGAGDFLSFDANQRRLAAAEKLRLNP